MKLTLVGLPLGNIEDISLRAVKALDQADLVICEDTRVFHKLWQKLMNLGILNHPYPGVLRVINEFNEKARAQQLLTDISSAQNALLISDAGLPTVSDPGFALTNAVLSADGELDIIPGPTAATTALAVSGLSSDRSLFVGFLPKKQAKRDKVWQMAQSASTDGGLTLIVYEAPQRVVSTLKEAQEKLGDLAAVVARELTKQHSSIYRGKISDLLDKLPLSLKGEFVLLFRL